MSKSGSSNKPMVAYGALYLDRGERMKVVKEQVKGWRESLQTRRSSLT